MEADTIAAQQAALADSTLRERLARRFTPEALRTQLRFSALFFVLCSVTLVKHLLVPPTDRSRYFSSALWVVSSLWYAVRAWRQQPRNPESFNDAELRGAVAKGRACPRCASLVLLQAESRCSKCGSYAANFTIDLANVALLLLLVGAVALAFIYFSSR